MAERASINLNNSVLKQISKVLAQDPAADLEAVLKKVCTPYAKLRQSVRARHKKDSQVAEVPEEENLPVPAQPRTIRVLLPFASLPQSQLFASELYLDSGPPSPLAPVSCILAHEIIYPLSPVACNLLNLTEERSPYLSSMILRCAFSGKLLWESLSRAVIQVSENIVVKVAQGLDQDEHGILQFLEELLPCIPVPRALGLVKVGNTSFMFMTLIPGTTLEKCWPSLSANAKAHVQHSLDNHFLALRQLEFPCGASLGSPVGRRACKDARRDERISTASLHSEREFNNFLLDCPSSRAAPRYKEWLHSMLRNDHRIVFTHSDLHPRNIMVIDGPDGPGSAELSGIIDWESSGYYPEYWEQLKAMNTRSIMDTSDWWDYLPPSILGYDHSFVLDRLIESTVMY